MGLAVDQIRNDAACERNSKRTHKHDGYPCLVCDAPCADDGKAVWVYLHDGGSLIVTAAEYEARNAAGQEAAQMGAYPIGPNCYRKIKALIDPYIVRQNGGASNG